MREGFRELKTKRQKRKLTRHVDVNGGVEGPRNVVVCGPAGEGGV